MNLLFGLAVDGRIYPDMGVNVRKPPAGAAVKCICQDSDFVAAYRSKRGRPEAGSPLLEDQDYRARAAGLEVVE